MDISKNGIECDFGNGNLISLSPLGPSDFHACSSHFNNRKMLVAIDALEKSGSILSIEDKIKVIDNYMDKKYSEKQLRGLLMEIPAICFLLWRSAKRNNPDISITDIEVMLTTDKMEEVVAILLKLMAPPANFPKPETTPAVVNEAK